LKAFLLGLKRILSPENLQTILFFLALFVILFLTETFCLDRLSPPLPTYQQKKGRKERKIFATSTPDRVTVLRMHRQGRTG
jgi:hypothetical protein